MDAVTAPVMTKKQAMIFFAVVGLLFLCASVAWLYLPQHLIRLGIFGLAACIGGLLVFAFPKYGLYFVLFYVYAGITYYTSLPVAPAVTFLVTAAVAIRLVHGDSILIRDPLFLWSLAVFTMFVFQSFLFAWNYRRAFESFDFFVKSVLLVFVIGQLIRTEKDVDRLALVLFAATLAAVFLGAMNVRLGIVNEKSPTVITMGWQRFSATHLNVNRAALYFVAGLPLGVYAVKRFRHVIVKTLLVIGVVVVVLATIMTFSRQTIFSLSIILLGILFREARSKWIYVVVGLVVVIGIVLIPDFYWRRIATITEVLGEGTTGDWSLATRLTAFKTAWRVFLDHPFTGVGLNNFAIRSFPELVKRIGAHNGYLEILTGVGLFGFIAFILVAVSGIRGYVAAVRTRWTDDRRWMKDVSFYFLLSGIAVFTELFFEQSHFYRVVWLPIAVGLVSGRLAAEARSPEKKSET